MPIKQPTHTEFDKPFDHDLSHQPDDKTPTDLPFNHDRHHQDVAPTQGLVDDKGDAARHQALSKLGARELGN